MTRPLIALLTDFGQTDTYVGVMKGVMRSICPEADFIDLTHGVRPQAVAQAAFLLSVSVPHFPHGTVFLSVVDPGVGSDRAALAARVGEHLFVAPDNGLLSMVWREDAEAHSLIRSEYRLPQVSATFHGRDIFAPAAAHLAAGVSLANLGPRVTEIERLALAHPSPVSATILRGAVVHIDHFGNLVTNIRTGDLAPALRASRITVQTGGAEITGLRVTYSEADEGELLAHWGSSGHLEIAVRGGCASGRLAVDIGEPVLVRW